MCGKLHRFKNSHSQSFFISYFLETKLEKKLNPVFDKAQLSSLKYTGGGFVSDQMVFKVTEHEPSLRVHIGELLWLFDFYIRMVIRIL